MEIMHSITLSGGCPYELPVDVRECVTGWFGAAGTRWLIRLPRIAARLMRDWDLEPDGPAFGGGTQALVLPVRRRDGSEAVLKIAHPDPDNVLESRALGIHAGRGTVRAYRRAPRVNAMLLERIRPGLPLARAMSREQMLRVQGALLQKATCTLPSVHPFPTASSHAATWLAWIRDHAATAAGTVPQETGSRLEAFLTDMVTFSPHRMLVNSDGHCGNILSSLREGWLLVDPKPVAGCADFEAGCMFAPFAFGSLEHLPEAEDTDNLGELFLVACEARNANPVLSGDWAAAKALYNYLWAISVGSPEIHRMADLLPPYMEATLSRS